MDFISQTDDDWDVDLGQDVTDDITVGKKAKLPKNIEHKASVNRKHNFEGTGPRPQAPAYPTPRRRDANGLKPQFEVLVRGEMDR